MDAVVTRGDKVIGWNIKVAQSFMPRLVGLLGKKKLIPGEGLLLQPCNRIHTYFMSLSIDVMFLDAQGYILEIIPAMQPGRRSPRIKGCWQVLELPAGTLQQHGLTKGQKLEILLP